MGESRPSDGGDLRHHRVPESDDVTGGEYDARHQKRHGERGTRADVPQGTHEQSQGRDGVVGRRIGTDAIDLGAVDLLVSAHRDASNAYSSNPSVKTTIPAPTAGGDGAFSVSNFHRSSPVFASSARRARESGT